MLLLLALTPTMSVLQPCASFVSRDIFQAYNQFATAVSRPLYLEVPKELGLPPGNTIMLIKPLYGVPEAGVNWLYMYHRFHITELGMKSSDHDLCMLFTLRLFDSTSDHRSLTVKQTDDILTICNPSFFALATQHVVVLNPNPCTLQKLVPLIFSMDLKSRSLFCVSL